MECLWAIEPEGGRSLLVNRDFKAISGIRVLKFSLVEGGLEMRVVANICQVVGCTGEDDVVSDDNRSRAQELNFFDDLDVLEIELFGVIDEEEIDLAMACFGSK